MMCYCHCLCCSRRWHSASELLQLLRLRAHLELAIRAEGELASSLACDATIDDAVQQGVAAQAVVAVDAAGCLARHVKPWDHARLGDAFGVDGALQPSHAVMYHGRDDGNVERLRGNLGAIDDIMIELLAAASRAAGCIPRLSAWVGRVRATIWILLGFLCRVVVLLVRVNQRLQRYAHVRRQRGAVLVELHHTAARVVLGVP